MSQLGTHGIAPAVRYEEVNPSLAAGVEWFTGVEWFNRKVSVDDVGKQLDALALQ